VLETVTPPGCGLYFWDGYHPDFESVQRENPMLGRVQKNLVRFMKREDGPTAVEYAVMLALIIVVCIASVRLVGTNANSTFSNTALNGTLVSTT
jgi:pilus assembly protein Flp/PilA